MTPEVKNRIEQIRHGNVPEGYKKTKASILPADWTVCTIADCLERVERPVEVQLDEMYTQIGIRSHGKGLFHKEPVTGESLGNKAVYWIEPDRFVLNIVFAWEQAIGKTTQAEVGMIGSHRFPMYRPIDGKVDIDYLISYLLTKRGKDILEAASPGGAGRNRTLGQDRFMKSKVVLPSPNEQKKIAEILTAQDKVIELKEKRLAEKQRQKKYLMQRFFDDAFRTNDDDSCNVKVGDIGDFYGGLSGKSAEEFGVGKAKYIAFKNVIGNTVIDTNILDAVSVGSGETQNAVKKGDLFFNLSSETAEEVGMCAVLLSDVVDTYLNSFCTGFRLSASNVDPLFLAYYFNSPAGRKIMFGLAQGVTRINLNKAALANRYICMPAYDRQINVARILSAADREIDLLRQELEQEKQKKKALMQLLLTGIVRVNA